ncbi:hypothetical protein QTJ16_005620 [Diplocarpon rosae]|uniref:methionyl-tRNA formyltransferase n=1 Tax=Diplocarpon rosae TaxID=946125 RepID=A0AAD9SWV8_9HELO|nr:hypothetical protein QTJ16_005620 [Diplocarpon rosae]
MISLPILRPVITRYSVSVLYSPGYGRRFYSTKECKPLRILFCGSDDFSIASLRALHSEHLQSPDLIKSIDVLCRPGKPTGRSLKKIRQVPIKAAAEELGLPVHERDTFTGWEPNDEPINLIIAVSFGLFVPPRILQAAEYGGLNVHPSLLPQGSRFRGPAPLQRAIMTFAKVTGVTLQTLDDKSFDHGLILAQKQFHIPDRTRITYPQLLDFVKPQAAALLVSGLRDRVFVPPLVEVRPYLVPKKLTPAPKITSEDTRIDFHHPGATYSVPAIHRALGRLWGHFWLDPTTQRRLIFEDIEAVERPSPFLINGGRGRDDVPPSKEYRSLEDRLVSKGVLFVVPVRPPAAIDGRRSPLLPLFYVEDGDAVIFSTYAGALRVTRITMEGQPAMPARQVLRNMHKFGVWRLRFGERAKRAGRQILVVEDANAADESEMADDVRTASDESIFSAAGF